MSTEEKREPHLLNIAGERLLNLLLVKPEELPLLLLLGANLFLATLTLIVSQIVSETLFLSTYGGDVLIYVYMVNGIGAVVAGAVYGKAQGKFRAGSFEIAIVMIFTVLFALLWPTIEYSPKWMLILFMVFAEIFGTLIILQAWNINGALLTTRSAKRLMPVISGFGTIAGVLSGLLVGVLAEPLGTVNLIGIVVAALLLMTAMGYPLAKRLCVSLDRIAPKVESKPEGGARRFATGSVLGNRHLRVLLAMTAIATLTSMLVDYQFKVFSQAHYMIDGRLDKDGLSGFYGNIQVMVSVLALTIQFGMASRIVERFGLAMTLALLPLVILTGALGIVLGIGSYFAAATVSRTGDKVLKFSLYGSTNQMLFMALPEHLQKSGRTLSNAVVRPIAFVLAGLLLIFVTQGLQMGDATIGWIVAALALVWIFLSVTAERRYLMSLLNQLARNRIRFNTEKIEITDPEAIEQVRSLFRSSDNQRVIGGIELTRRIKGVDMLPEVLELTYHEDAEVRAAAARFLGEAGGARELERLRELISDDDHSVRAAAAEGSFVLGGATRNNLDPLRPYLEGSDLAVRSVALSFFLASENAEERRVGDDLLSDMAGSADPEMRVAALDAIMHQSAQTCSDKVLAALEDPVAEVRHRAALAATAVNCPEVWNELLRLLGEGQLNPLQVAALGTAGVGVVPRLREMLNDLDLPIPVRRQAAQVLGRIGGPEALEALLERLHRPLLTVPLEAARAAARIVVAGGKPLPRAQIAGALDLLYKDAYETMAILADFDESDLREHVGVFRLVLRRRFDRVLDTLFQVFRLAYPPDIIDLAVACLETQDVKQLEAAIEVLNQALDHEDRVRAIPLIESQSPAAILSVAGSHVDVQRFTAEDRIERWLRHTDPWRSTAALWTIAEACLQQLREKTLEHLDSEHAVVRETAVLAAWRIQDPGSGRIMLEPLRADSVESIRMLVADLLDSHGHKQIKRTV